MPEHLYIHGSPDSGHPSDEESGGQYGSGHDSIREQDRLLPIANVSRIMKKALPANAKISKEAKETVQECVSEFISFITGEASDKCQREKRKTVNGDDLLWAMGTLGFEDYLEPLKLYLHKYREVEGEKATMAKQGEMGMGKDVGCGAMMGGGQLDGNGGLQERAMQISMIQQQQQQQQQQPGPPPSYMFSQHQQQQHHHFTQSPFQMQQPIPGNGNGGAGGNVRQSMGTGGHHGGGSHIRGL